MAHMIAKMVSMARSPEKIKEDMPAAVAESIKAPVYPYGLCLSVCDEEVAKLKLSDAQIGETIHIFAMAKVTSVSKRDDEDGGSHRIELQITDMAVENEDRENAESDPVEKEQGTLKKWYGGGPRSEED